MLERLPVLFAFVSFLSAFLLFEIQPLLSRMLLPLFGGSSAVWSGCMVFFQTTLLLGYLVAYTLIRWCSVRAQKLAYLTMFGVSVWMLLHSSGSAVNSASFEANPVWEILRLLCVLVGLPYLVLSSTSPLLQSWYAKAYPGRSPFGLYRMSNLGSLLALVTYPILIEPALYLSFQFILWLGMFLVLTATIGIFVWRFWSDVEVDSRLITGEGGGEIPTARSRLIWFTLPFLSSVILLGITHHLTIDVTPMPLLWVVPLVLYLASFIMCFQPNSIYSRRIWFLLLAGVCFFYSGDFFSGADVPMLFNLVFCLGALFIACVVCHAEVFRVRPTSDNLASFYLILAAGSAAGSIFVALVAPQIFSRHLELPLALGGLLILHAAIITSDSEPLLPNYPPNLFPSEKMLIWAFCSYGLLWFYFHWESSEKIIFRERNFYGELRVVEQINSEDPRESFRSLINGRILHGAAYLDPDLSRLPMSYYGSNSALAPLFDYLRSKESLKIGVVGLGTGACAAWKRPGDRFRFYEIDPMVPRVAAEFFPYIKSADPSIEIVMGDARISLTGEAPQEYDLIILDAFSSDAIPFHLLTEEAVDLYLRHLAPGGLLAVHVSNRHLNLEPIVLSVAHRKNMHGGVVLSGEKKYDLETVSTYVVIGENGGFFRAHGVPGKMRTLDLEDIRARVWSDDYSSTLGITRWVGVDPEKEVTGTARKITDIADLEY